MAEQDGEMIRDFYLSIICAAVDKDPVTVLYYKGKKRIYLEPKQVLQYALCEYTKMSFQTVANLTFKESHATIMSNCGTIKNLLETDRNFRDRYDSALRQIEVQGFKRCVIIGETRGRPEDIKNKFKAAKEYLLRQNKFPVSPLSAINYTMNRFDAARQRYNDILRSYSVYVLPDYLMNTDCVLELNMAQRLGLEIIMADQEDINAYEKNVVIPEVKS